MRRKILALCAALAMGGAALTAYAVTTTAVILPGPVTERGSLTAPERAVLAQVETILDRMFAQRGYAVGSAETRLVQGQLVGKLLREKLAPSSAAFARLTPARKSLVNALATYAKERMAATDAATGTPAADASAPASSAATVGGCPVFPSDNAWNQDVSQAPVHPNSANYIKSIGLTGHLHADFGGGGAYGIPWVAVDKNQPKLPINFTAYGDESDPGPYPVPRDAPIEGGKDSDGDRHVLVVDTSDCVLYELYRAFPTASGWDADSAAKFDLKSNALRPAGWTSADAAGLPIFPGLARYEEAKAGAITHALRFTVRRTQKAYVAPARHYASSSTDKNLPPMGLRLRLKADYDISRFTGQARVVLEALKKYGMIVADNGSDWFITGDANQGWNDEDLNQLKTVPGSAFEAVETK